MAKKRRAKRLDVEPLEVQIEDLTHEGDGVCRIDGKATFVHGALPGEKVMAKPVRRFRSYDEADLVEVLEASDERVEPRCEVFGTCGGCSMQHLAEDKQIARKQQILLDNLERLGKVAPKEVLEPLRSSAWGYRRKARLGVKSVFGKGRVLVGFRERSAPYITDTKQCEILAEPVGQLLMPLSEMIEKLSIASRLPQIEVAIGDNATALVFRILEDLTDADREVLLAFGKEHNVQMWLQTKGPDTVHPMPEQGDVEPLYYEIPAFDVKVEFLPSDFTQINPEINRQMVPKALELLQVEQGHNVLELFSGLGNFTLPLAKQAAKVVTVEGDDGLVKRAHENALRQGFDNVETHVGNLFEDQSDMAWSKGKYERVLLDPARSGADEILPTVAATGAERIVYVSCHPGTLSRDAGILVNEFGYTLEAAGVMDMFPHTAHVESIALFVKNQ
ncbi:MAG: 23S rRNA (uracil(1939)-C(5))-methyltransferase RlmD [Gammaproteobacteria bacterium]|nr:23S rRNA (uracil(1939)-C(5))-methyltransferase RlmD [Gammaproteobacteria bacterium]